MGTWAPGPFGNDAALDWVASVFDGILPAIDGFMACPEIDGTFDEAFAAIGVLNALMAATPGRPWRDGAVLAAGPIRTALLTCYDSQIDGMEPSPSFKAEQRAALVAALDTFARLLRPWA